jgi:hypothetical protein
MTLQLSPAPAAALRSVLSALSSPAAVRETRTPALRSPAVPLVAEHPLPAHVLDPAGGGPGGLPRVRLTGWRFHLRVGEITAAAGEATRTADGWTFSHFFEGPYLASTERALRQGDALAAPYQPHLLSVPGLYMLTLWLHADVTADPATAQPGAADLLIPLAPAPPGIAAHRIHRLSDLVPVLSTRIGPPPLLETSA